MSTPSINNISDCVMEDALRSLKLENSDLRNRIETMKAANKNIQDELRFAKKFYEEMIDKLMDKLKE